VLDDGVAYEHPDLDGNAWVNRNDPIGGGDQDGNGYVDDFYGWNFVDNNNDPRPVSTQTHGTLVAGVIAAETNNAAGVAGVAGGTHVLFAAGTNAGDQKSGFSDYGAYVDLAAPGENVVTTWTLQTVSRQYDYTSVGHPTHPPVSGTSFTAPLVAGVAGLILAQ